MRRWLLILTALYGTSVLASLPPKWPGAYVLRGCYENTGGLDSHREQSHGDTLPACIATCRDLGCRFAGPHKGDTCLCGDTYTGPASADNCDIPCSGDAKQIFGYHRV